MSKNLLLIFTRNPELGKVKTRLAKTIGAEKALAIYKFLLAHTKKVIKNIACDKAVYYSEKVREDDQAVLPWSIGMTKRAFDSSLELV